MKQLLPKNPLTSFTKALGVNKSPSAKIFKESSIPIANTNA